MEEFKNEYKNGLKVEQILAVSTCACQVITIVTEVINFIQTGYIESLINAIYAMFAAATLGVLIWIYKKIKGNGTPFIPAIASGLMVLACFIFLSAFIPELVRAVVNFNKEQMLDFRTVFGSKTIFISWIGIIIFFISWIFRYGIKLQEDVDSIA